MNRRLSSACLALAVLLLGSTAPLASQGISFGAAASYAEDTDFGVGPRVSLAIPAGDLGLSLVGSFGYFLPSDADADALGVDLSAWELNGNLVLDIPAGGGAMAPYLGAGVNYSSRSISSGSRSESFSDAGLNLLAGLRFASAGPSPFLEGRYTMESGEFEGQFVVAAGVQF